MHDIHAEQVIQCDQHYSLEPAMVGWPWLNEQIGGQLMGQSIVIRRAGNLIDISADGTSSLQEAIRNLIEPILTYTHQQFVYGADQYDSISGYKKGPVRFEECRLFRYDGFGRLVCGVGLLPKILERLKQADCSVIVQNCNPQHSRPNRFTEDWTTVAQLFKLRPKQDDCLVAIATNEYGIIKAPTGFGKGMMIAIASCLYPNAKIHVIVPGKDLVRKTVASLVRYIPNVGQVGDNKIQFGRVTVFSADSLHRSDGDADFIFADEIHKLAAPSYSEALAQYKYSRNFGFSATPTGRFDGADAKLESLFGPIIFDLSYTDAIQLGLVVPIAVDWLDVRISPNPCANVQSIVAKKRHGIWRNEERNKIIAQKALSYDSDDQVLILVETIEHLFHLKKHLPDFETCYSANGLKQAEFDMYKRWGLIDPSVIPLTVASRETLRKDFESGKVKKAIATGVWATGVDFEQLAVLIRADALSSTIMDVQAPGRVSRINTKGEKSVGIVVDCIDQFDEGYRRKAMGRRKSYASIGWTQK